MKKIQCILFLGLLIASSIGRTQIFCSDSPLQEESLAEQIIRCESELKKVTPKTIDDIRQWIVLSNLYRKSGDAEESIKQLEQLSYYAEQIGVNVLYEINFAQGTNYYYARKYLKSLNYFKLALNNAIELQDSKSIANSYNALANIAQVFADYDSMSLLLEKSLEIFKKNEDSEGIAKILNNLGNTYRFNGDNNKALVMYRQSLIHHQQQNDRLKIAHTRMNMTRSLIMLEQFEKAVELLKLSVDEFKYLGATHRMIEANGLIARIYLQLNNLERAEKYLQQNKELKLQIDANHFDLDSELVLANFYQTMGKKGLAKQLLIRGITIANKQLNIEQLKKYLTTLTALLEDMKQSSLAGDYLQKYADVLTQAEARKKRYFGELHFISRPELTQILEKKVLDKTPLLSIVTTSVAVSTLLSFSFFFIYWYSKKRKTLKVKVINYSVDESSCFFSEERVISKEIVDDSYHEKNKETDKRQRLVELMLLALQLWEQDIQEGRLELAEKSKIWKVTNDDGRLRVRAMERYLCFEKLPAKPRWRNVIRTCHFVLSKCKETTSLRISLTTKLSEYLDIVKKSATS